MIRIGNVADSGHDSIWGRVYDPKGLSPALNAEGGGVGAKTGLYPVPIQNPRMQRKLQNGRQIKEPGDHAHTHCASGDAHGIVCQTGIRRLTPVECERLQGFPDGWTEWGIDSAGRKVRLSDTRRYKCTGNAVSTNVIARIIEKWNLPT